MPSLPITDFVPRIQYTATQGQVNFVVPFPFFALTDVAVYLTPATTIPSDYFNKLTYNTNYTISQNANMTGTVTLNVAANAGDTVTIVREMPDQRLNYYLQGGSFTADAVNTDFESQVLMIQQNQMYDKIVAPHYNLSATPLQPNNLGGQDIILPVLQAGQTWVKDPTNNFITATLVGNGDSVNATVQQNNHGFTVGQVVYYTGATYALALASDANQAEAVGMVSSVVDVNTFKMITNGFIANLTTLNLTPGGTHFLSDTSPGALTLIEPTTVGHISKPLLIAVSPSSGYFFNFRGEVVPAPTPPAGTAGTQSAQVTQPNHGFTVGNVLYSNAGTFALALATNEDLSEVVGIVTAIIDANNFMLTTGGLVQSVSIGLPGLTPGATYFLSDTTSGLLTTIEPTTVGNISKPLMIATSATTGYFFNFRGEVIPAPSFSWQTDALLEDMVQNQGYITTATIQYADLLLPETADVGSTLRICGQGAAGWRVSQNDNQVIHFGSSNTTVGQNGYIASNTRYDAVELLCVVANLEWVVISSSGALNVI